MISEATGLIRIVVTPAPRIVSATSSVISVPAETIVSPEPGWITSSRSACPTSGSTGSSTSNWETIRRYGVSIKPYWLILP